MKSYLLNAPKSENRQAASHSESAPAEPIADYEKYLSGNKLVPQAHLRFYTNWARQFLRHCGHPDKETRDEIPIFAESLRKSPHIKDWQITQAINAARLYIQMTSPTPTTSQPPPSPQPSNAPGDPAPGSWDGAIEIMQKRFRVLHYSVNTDKTYIPWIWRFHDFLNKENPHEATPQDVQHFLTHLALHDRVSASAQNQAFNALIFFFRFVLKRDISGLSDTIRARRRKPLPVVLSRDEVRELFKMMGGTTHLMARLVYGSGIRSRECVALRVQDLDFNREQLIVRGGKGDKDRSTLLPRSLHEPLRAHLERVRKIHLQDLAHGYGEVWLPEALGKKFPNAAKEWIWQYVFPSTTLATDTDSNKVRRFHASRSTLRKAIQAAGQHARIPKRIGTHTLRHCFATHLLEDNVNIRVIQELLGHRNIETTMIYTHVMQKNVNGVRSPLDTMECARTPTITGVRDDERNDVKAGFDRERTPNMAPFSPRA